MSETNRAMVCSWCFVSVPRHAKGCIIPDRDAWREMAEKLAGLLRGVDMGEETFADETDAALAEYERMKQ